MVWDAAKVSTECLRGFIGKMISTGIVRESTVRNNEFFWDLRNVES